MHKAAHGMAPASGYGWAALAAVALAALLAVLTAPAVRASQDRTSDEDGTRPADDPGLWMPPRCIGDGVAGYRLQLVFVHESGQPSRLPEVADRILRSAAFTTWVFEQSSGGLRSPRWVTDAQCMPSIVDVTVPEPVMHDSGPLRSYLQATGEFGSRIRLYAVYVDAEPAGNWAGLGGGGWAFAWQGN